MRERVSKKTENKEMQKKFVKKLFENNYIK